MNDDAERAIQEEIGDQWNTMIENRYIPAMTQDERIHRLASTEDSEMSARDIGIYEAGILRGLEIARGAVEDAGEDDE